MNKILIIEDDKEISQIEKDFLMQEGYEIFQSYSGKSGLEDFLRIKPDLVILDINLPEMDGISVCKTIRQSSGVPIVMVTAKTKEIDELLGLDVGADDYIKKPFSPRILVTRVKSLLRRPAILVDNSSIVYGDISLDTEKRTLMKQGKQIEITTIQFDILQTLMQSRGKVFARDELMDRVYTEGDMVDIFDRTIDSHIKNIRKLIEEDPHNPKIILTIRGIGYKFNENI